MNHLFDYNWELKNTKFTKDKGKVFSCFSCGGGSTMGYKLAGFDVIGCNEIDPKMMSAYIENHHPEYSFLESITTFKERKDLPEELYNLDILDGSPPCSSFSMAGNREKDWGKEKKFKEGQVDQVLDTLFFDFIDLAKELQPKVVIAENVKGMLMGEATAYVRKIYDEFNKAGYQLRVRPYLLDSSKMGVPQKRERVFFIAIRNDLADQFMEQVDMFQVAPKIDMSFNEPIIPLKDFVVGVQRRKTQNYRPDRFGDMIVDVNKPNPTIVTINRYWLDEDTLVDDRSLSLIGSYPTDYNHLNFNNAQYLIGMSVPPVMMAQIALRVYNQIINKL